MTVSDLALELSLITLLVALIGWFVGRFICKSGEQQLRAEKRQLEQQLNTQETELKHRDQLLTTAQEQLNQLHVQVDELEQQRDSVDSRIDALRQERKELLEKQQQLEVDQARLVTVSSELEVHKKQLHHVQTERTNLARELDDLQTQLHSVTKKLKTKEAQNREQQEELEGLRQENDKQQVSIQTLEQEQHVLKELKISHEEALSRIRMQDEEKQNLFARYTDIKNEYHQIRKQCETMTHDSLQFNERFSSLIKEKELLNQEIEHLNIEKHDYIGRLRAISNVIDVVGTEPERLMSG